MVLTGDGADELYAGYDKYRNFFTPEIDAMAPGDFRKSYQKNISLFDAQQREKLFTPYFKADLGGLDISGFLDPLFEKSKHMDRINQALYIDTMLLLPGNNLVKPDRMGMAVSLENRAPFLDFRMIELAFSMPGNLKLREGVTKYLYKKAVTPLIGGDLAYRKKQMFTVPIGNWFKNELAPMCKDLLLSSRAQDRGVLNGNYVRDLWENHIIGKENNTREIRALMALELWFRGFLE
jgi:asparagine synthase (glutamine-hydrolysing)